MFTVKFEKGSSRKWFVALGVFLLTTAGLGLASGTLSLYVVPITESLGVARSVYTLYDTVAKVVGFLLCMSFNIIYKRVGAKGLAILAGIGYSMQFFLMSVATNVLTVWIGGVFSGIGYTLAGTLTIFAIIPPWDEKNVGFMTGLCAASSGLASSIVLMLAKGWIADFGYRTSCQIEAACIMALCLIAMLLVKTAPNDPIAGVEAKKNSVTLQKGSMSYREMFKNKALFIGVLIFFLVGGLGGSFSQIIIPLSTARGLGDIGVAAYAAHYITIVFAKPLVGIGRDRIGMKIVMPVLFALNIAAIIGFGWGDANTYSFMGYVYGIGTCISQLVPPYLFIQAFGKYYNAGMVAIGLGLYQIGRAIGTPAIHISYDLTGSYDTNLIIWVALWLVVLALCYLFVNWGKKYQAKRAAQEAAETPAAAPVEG